MRKKSFREIPGIVSQSNRRRIWRKVVGVLSCIVVFSTTYALILPALTMEKAPVSGKEDHTHTHDESCYSIPEAHAHGEGCYTRERGDLTCSVPEGEPAHTHSPDAGCYEETQEQICPLEESEEHRHGDACYETSSELICALSDQAHQHTDECYAWSNVLTCTESTAPAEPVLTCGREEILLPQPQEYRYEDDTVLVTVVLPAESKVPKDASLRVVPINQAEERYSQLEQQAQATVEGELNQLVLYDVSFYTKEGAYLPVEDSAAVNITFKQEVLTGGDQVEVLHYGEDAAPVALEGVEIQRNENQALSGIAFQTEGFSVFGVMTTRAAETRAAETRAADTRASTGISLYLGQVYTVDEVYTDKVEHSTADVVKSHIETYPNILKTGNDYDYSVDRQHIDNAVYTFNLNENGKYTAYHSSIDSNGNVKNIYFDMSTGNAACPSSDREAEFSILDKDSTPTTGAGVVLPNDEVDYHIPEDRFALSSDGPHRLFFHNTTENPGTRLGFEVQDGVYSHWGCNLVLFKKAEGSSTGPIPGFVQATQKSEITDGGQYLIAGRASESVDGDYYVLYPNLSAENRYQHAAKVSPYKLTLTGNTVGTTTVTAGKQQWNVTVNDQISLSKGKSIDIKLPTGASVVVADNTIATVSVDSTTGNATVTGLDKGSTSATVTTGDRTYTWDITVTKPNSFKFTYNHGNNPVITFHFKNKDTEEDLEVEVGQVKDYVGQTKTKYRLVTEGTPMTGDENVKDISIPSQIDGLPFSGAIYYRSYGEEYRGITCFATTGYSDSDVTVQENWNFLFYDEANPSYELNLDGAVAAVDIYLYYASPPINTTVSPSGTIINLFDYWVTEENEGQVFGKPNEGINKDHVLHFTTREDELLLNQWTGGINVLQGIVENRLGSDGYPYLSGNHQVTEPSTAPPGDPKTESLAYLFDPAYNGDSAEFRNAYRNVGGLLQLDKDGYYYYDSTKNYAEFDRHNNRFHLYPNWSVYYDISGTYGQFFPFDPYSAVSRKTKVPHDQAAKPLNHFFGMTMSTRFMQRFGGHTSTEKTVPMTFEFAGDDDVWIFIDGVLVADLGGIHNAASVKINFAAGTVVINEGTGHTRATKFSDIFANTNLENGTFKDNSYHTLKFYYMERGGVASNLHLKFNLVTVPTSGITKVDQEGAPIKGAEFSLYRTDENYEVPKGATPICSGTTDADGEFVFTDGEGHPMVLQELYHGSDNSQLNPTETYPYYVLQETRIPQGYRGTGTDIHLKITEGTGSGNVNSYVMSCTNTRDSGAYASPSLQVTASSTLYLCDGDNDPTNNTPIVPGHDIGTLFGVVLKYIGPEGEHKDLTNEEYWSPVYGSASEGYTVMDKEQYPDIRRAIQVAKDHYPGNQNYFHPSSNGSYQALMEDLPGDIASYNFMAGNEGENARNVKYIIAYYWTDAATKETTRVQDYTNGGIYSFSRTFGTDIHIPNMKNRIAVQKLDEDNETPLNGAKFAMYRVDDQADVTGHDTTVPYYYVPDGAAEDNMTHIFLEPDAGDPFKGNARLCTDTADTADTGTYKVDCETGIINVEIKNIPYTIKPTQVETTVDSTHNNYKEDGIAEFEGMVSGNYIIRELTAPFGYEVNPNHVMVLVTDNAIYANAGKADDGIAVSRGPGYLAGNLHYYATRGDVDNTLSWVYTQMKVSKEKEPGESDKFSDVTPENYNSNKWEWVQTSRDEANNPDANQPGAANALGDRRTALTAYLEFFESGSGSSADETGARSSYVVDLDTDRPHNVSDKVSRDRLLYTKTGWSYLEILQDYAYGCNSKSPNANYEDWRYGPDNITPDDLSNLFSRSVYIHVTDTKLPRDLEITKTVINQPESEDTSFNFTVTLANPTKPVDGTYKYTVYDNSNPAADPRPVIEEDGKKLENLDLIFTDGEAKDQLSLKHNQAAVIQGIPEGSTYQIKEDKLPKYTTTAVEKVLITDPQGTREDTVEYNGSVVSGSMYWHVENGVPDNLSKVDFTNTYDEALDTGYELPETGGMGTTLIYIMGGILVMGAGLPLVTKKRMGAKK